MADKNQRVSFQRFIQDIDAEGITVSAWENIRSAWAEVQHRSGSQKWAGGRYSETVTDLFTIRAVPGWEPNSSMRLIWRDKIYDIESVDDIKEEHKEVEIRAVYTGKAKGA